MEDIFQGKTHFHCRSIFMSLYKGKKVNATKYGIIPQQPFLSDEWYIFILNHKLPHQLSHFIST